MPVAVCLGGDPAYTFAATAPLPDGLDEILFAGFIRKKSVELVKCKTIDLEVPADVDFVLEGYVQPGETRPEGPFGDHTGFYTAVEDYPVFHLTAITHRQDAVYPSTIVGIPPMEDFYMGDASVRVFLPVFKMNFPEIVDMALPAGRRLPQPRLRQHPEAVSVSGLQDHARPLGHGADDVQQIHRGGG